ncbi:MAG: heat-inducible transcription repressor HrcA [Abditibacteriota bacterium]|nr:heat-inducible transcription repressor HrcA [Abditibacteriota bacterium]
MQDKLPERKKLILKAVVTDYVITAEPVASKTLVGRYIWDVKSATIRNDMAELADMGYLCQPHTSAGRIPSDMGYRFYVDKLMDSHKIPSRQAGAAKDEMAERSGEIDNILDKSCGILADLARCTAVATQPNINATRISAANVSDVQKGKFLAVIVLDNGRVVHGFVNNRGLDARHTTNFLTGAIVGKTMDEARDRDVSDEKYAPFFEDIKKILSDEIRTDVHLRGTGYIMKQPEFKDAGKLGTILQVLEDKQILARLLSTAFANPGVTVIIGSENTIDEMKECSFVGKQYTIGGRPVGSIGVIGPTRMDYKKSVAAVKFMSSNLTALLEQLGI